MEVSVTDLALDEIEADLLLVPLDEERSSSRLEALADLLGPSLLRAEPDISGDAKEQVLLYPDRGQAKRVAFVGVGPGDELDAERLRRAAARGAGLAIEHEADTVAVLVPALGGSREVVGKAVVEGFMLGAYRFLRYKTQRNEEAFGGVQQLTLRPEGEVSDTDDEHLRQGAQQGKAVASATMTARDLVNMSPDEKTATDLAGLIEQSGERHGFETEVWDKRRIEAEGMGGLLAVNRGSLEPPTFTTMEWKPSDAVNEKPIVLIGKTVVFDTGGLSLKPTKNSMDFMKADMAGGAAVVGAFEAVSQLELPVHLVGLIPATDNRPGEAAYVPGDVIHMHDGTTVEVLNTDAEGRMTLADALSHARSYDPELVIDLATLTGAAVVALGSEAAAVMSSIEEASISYRESIEQAGHRSGDRVHPLPMYEEYEVLLESEVADVKNIGGKEAGCITAAKFLERFADYPWVHLDIAGPAFLHEAKPYRPKGGTGYGVRLLVEFLRTFTEQ